MSDYEHRLQAVLSSKIDDFGKISKLRQLTAGASQETWQITYQSSLGEKRVALRRAQPTAASGTAIGAVSLTTEAKLFHCALAAGVPGPEIIYRLKDGDGLGSGFVMQWLDGETLGHKINRDETLAETRKTLAAECGRILGRIHAVDWRAAGLERDLKTFDTAALIDESWQRYLNLDVPVPMIDYTRNWLVQNIPDTDRMTLVHGDFRNGNLMVNRQGINAVLDWELAHVGDPVRDLGWLCVNSWRFGNRDRPVGGFGCIDDLLAGYQAETGILISAQHLKFWEVFGSFWWSVCTMDMADAWRKGESPSLERPVIGRRSSEAQMDCVNLLIPGDFSLPDLERPLDHGNQLPMPAELLQGVAQFLKEDAAEGLDQRGAFLAKVAANSIGIAQRELVHGPELDQQELLRLRLLLGHGGDLAPLRRELCVALRTEQALDGETLTTHLRQTVAGRLAIDQPRYSALSQ